MERDEQGTAQKAERLIHERQIDRPVPMGGEAKQAGAFSGEVYDRGFTTVIPLRDRLVKAGADQSEGGRRLVRFAERLTPEIQETVEVLQEGIRLGVFSLDGSLTRY